MRDYTGYDQCEFCGKYNAPVHTYVRHGITRYDYSMVCDGIETLGTNPYAEEIHGDYTEYYECEGSRYESGRDI